MPSPEGETRASRRMDKSVVQRSSAQPAFPQHLRILACTILYICIIAEREIREHNMVFSIISPTQCEHLEEMTGSWGRDNHGFLTQIQFTLAVRTGHKIQQFLACGADRRACCIHFPITSNSSERYGTAATCFLLHQKMPETGPPDPPDCSSQ